MTACTARSATTCCGEMLATIATMATMARTAFWEMGAATRCDGGDDADSFVFRYGNGVDRIFGYVSGPEMILMRNRSPDSMSQGLLPEKSERILSVPRSSSMKSRGFMSQASASTPPR